MRVSLEHGLPALTAATAVTTIFSCYALARTNGDVPDWLHIVQISLLGCTGAERRVFQVGFVSTALLLACCIVLYVERALPRFERWLRCEIAAAAVLAIVGAAGLGLLGAVPLQRDCVACMLGGAEIQRESFVHGFGALVFFTSSWLHGLVSIHAYGRSPRHRASARLARARTLRLVFVSAPVLALPVQMAGAQLGSPRARMQVGAGHQWLAIGCMLGMYLSYADDLSHFAQRAAPRGDAERLSDADEGGGAPSDDDGWLATSGSALSERRIGVCTLPAPTEAGKLHAGAALSPRTLAGARAAASAAAGKAASR
ncbi:hypothetical protein KFE25_011373 [Diacronema lutheri]|uniref:CWH43-like N-terminal domain-containing protein n=1 Tax=Diacronema lutheri TaxID=2081491 RepID=A0A8J6CAL2_DIALT|nr:hypothetical protein KFE25_011373 [Diacronema lutheri]